MRSKTTTASVDAVMEPITLKGTHENQVSEGGEAELKIYRQQCEKNPGHKKFIPIESCSLNNLPFGYRNNDLYELIKAVADLTVRISVTMTSPDRPDFFPNTKIPYFLSDMRGKETFRTGSGTVRDMKKYTGEDKQRGCKQCPCDKCKKSDIPSKVWWEIYIMTAAHVLFDDIEASHTTVRFFYDKEDNPVVDIKDKVCIVDVNATKDKCVFTCVTCDENLGTKLEKMLERYEDVWRKVTNKYQKSRDTHKINFIVSHPHGCSKQVSVGQWEDMTQEGEYVDYTFTYTTCTCPGSSGAYVHCVGYSVSFIDHVHSGSLSSGLNFSGVGSVL